MTDTVTDDNLRSLLTTLHARPLERLHETGDSWGLGGSLRINKRYPTFSNGFGWDLYPTSRFYLRWFDFPDLGKRGWAIIFQVHATDQPEPRHRPAEYFAAWVPPEREKEARHWVDFLNAEIRDRLAATVGERDHRS